MIRLKHPKDKAERRRLALKKDRLKYERDESVKRRLDQEILEQKEALDVLRRKVPEEEN
jgi:hypothetical protein